MPDLLKAYPREFYERHAPAVARDLLGAVLCRALDGERILSGKIVETEAYTAYDPACHAFRGRTPRTAVMFGPPGVAYVYFIYGMYFCLNVVTEPDGVPGAVLIRAVDSRGCDGPGKLCRQWQITGRENGVSLMSPASGLWICPGSPVPDRGVLTSERIGISRGQEHHWRYFLKDHPAVSGRAHGKRASGR